MAYPQPSRRCVSSSIFRLNIHEFSHHVAERLLPVARSRYDKLVSGTSGAAPEFLVATCVFLPTYFVAEIRKRWPQLERLDQVPRGSFAEFEKAAAALGRDLLPSEESEDLERHRGSFITVARSVFPHFWSLQHEGAKALRICLFHRDLQDFETVQSEEERLEAYLRAFEAAHDRKREDVYLFFRWLNGENRCLVALPTAWKAIGLPKPRDFAVLNRELLVEFHRDEEIFIQVEPKVPEDKVIDWSRYWSFCDLELLARTGARAENKEIEVVEPDTFVRLAFFEPERLRARLLRRTRRLRDYLRNYLQLEGDTNARACLAELDSTLEIVPSVKEPRLSKMLNAVSEPGDFGEARAMVEKLRQLAAVLT